MRGFLAACFAFIIGSIFGSGLAFRAVNHANLEDVEKRVVEDVQAAYENKMRPLFETKYQDCVRENARLKGLR